MEPDTNSSNNGMNVMSSPMSSMDSGMGDDRKRQVALAIGVVLLIVIGVGAYFFFPRGWMPSSSPTPTSTSTPEVTAKRTDFGTSLPSGFPSDVPVEKGAKIEQSYTLAYPDQTQSSVVFLSSKSVSDNYSAYSAYLNANHWRLFNHYVSGTVSSLYGVKDNLEINITISTDATAKSQVSIGVLTK